MASPDSVDLPAFEIDRTEVTVRAYQECVAKRQCSAADHVSMTPEGGSVRFTFETPGDLAPFIASKGSVAVDGISLTVVEVVNESSKRDTARITA